MDFSHNKLPSSMKEIEWHWQQYILSDVDFSRITINGEKIDFTLPKDYFQLTDNQADNISFIGRKFSLYSQPVSMTDFQLCIWGDIRHETQIGDILGRIKNLRPTADVYGLLVEYKSIENSIFCAITVCFVDKECGEEMETAVIEIGQDESVYILPVAISEETLDYYSFDDLALLAYWLGNFWVGVQYELNNRPEEIRVINQRGPISVDQQNEIQREERPVLIKKVIPIDADGNEIKYEKTDSGRHYKVPVWGVRGHPRRLQDGRITYVRPYPKGKDRANPNVLVEKEYQFVDEKINQDVENNLK